MALVRCKVVGVLPIRDALTHEAVSQGNEVVLSDEPVPRKPGADGKAVKPLAATIIIALVESGAVEVLGPYLTPTAGKADS